MWVIYSSFCFSLKMKLCLITMKINNSLLVCQTLFSPQALDTIKDKRLSERRQNLIKGAFHSTKISRKFWSETEWNGSDQTGNFRKRRSTFRGWSVLIGSYCSIRKNFGLQYLSVVNFCPKLNGMARSTQASITVRKISRFTVPFATWNFRNFKPEFLVEWKAP